MPNARSFAVRVVLRLLTCALAVAYPSVGRSQSLTFGELVGTVLDSARRPIVGTEIRATHRSSGAIREASVGRDGRFHFGALAAGRYDVLAEALGFRPTLVSSVEVVPGRSSAVVIVLRREAPPVSLIDTVRAATSASSSFAWLLERGYADLLGTGRTLADIAHLTTTAGDDGIEGLPWRLTNVMIDGSTSVTVGAPGADGAEAAGLAFPLRGLAVASAGDLGFDAEASGTGVGLRATSLQGGWASVLRGGAEGGTGNYGAHAVATGALQSDTAQAAFGVDYQRSELSMPSLFRNATEADAYVAAADALSGTDLRSYAIAHERVTERIGGFGSLDFQPSDRFAMSMRASGSRLTSAGLSEPHGVAARLGSDYEALTAHAGVNAYARLSSRLTSELRLSADVAGVESRGGDLPPTTLAGAGVAVGTSEREPFDHARTTPRAATMLHADLGAHQLKLGFAVAVHRLDSRRLPRASNAFTFGDPADLANGEGVWRSVDGVVAAGEFSMTERAFFLQDSWDLVPGFEVTLGARWDGARLPLGLIERNAEWLAQSGLDNRAGDATTSSFSPRVALRWALGSQRQWVIEGGAGVFKQLPDGRDVAEALTFDRSASVRLGVGQLGSWPAAPSLADAPAVGGTLTMLGPGFEGPRTRRLALGLSRQQGDWTTFVNGVYRHTDFLARRRDLNRPIAPPGLDQHGRPLYGDLTKVGALLAAVPGTNRRFAGFDAVTVLEASGFSDYTAVTVGVERVRPAGFSMGVSYTFSRTEDNVPGLGESPQLSPFPEGIDGVDWVEGRSDLDVPHRLFAAADWTSGPDGSFRLGAVYRLASGAPFTPRVASGVDANADGSQRNDPAFVDAGLPGMGVLLDTYPCLREAVGRFVDRNSCRGDLQHRLDLRVSVRMMRLAAGRVDLVIDALDVLPMARGRFDDALLVVDRSSALTSDPMTGVTTVPYLANPGFGRVVSDRSLGALWRVGLRVVP